MDFTPRQQEILEIIKEHEPISGDSIAKKLGVSKATLRSDFAILTMTGLLDAKPKVGYFYSGQPVEPLLFEKLYTIQVKDIMIPPLLVKQDLSIYDAITTLFMYDVGSLYVTNEEDKLVGILSRKDFLRATISSNQFLTTPIAVIMTRRPNIVTIQKEERILDAGYLLLRHQVDTLPVVSESDPDQVIGKLTKTKMLSYFIQSGLKIEKEKF